MCLAAACTRLNVHKPRHAKRVLSVYFTFDNSNAHAQQFTGSLIKASSEHVHCVCERREFRRDCTFAQSRLNLAVRIYGSPVFACHSSVSKLATLLRIERLWWNISWCTSGLNCFWSSFALPKEGRKIHFMFNGDREAMVYIKTDVLQNTQTQMSQYSSYGILRVTDTHSISNTVYCNWLPSQWKFYHPSRMLVKNAYI